MTTIVRIVNESVPGDPGACLVGVFCADALGLDQHPVQILEAGQISGPLHVWAGNTLVVRYLGLTSTPQPAFAAPPTDPGH